MVDKLETSGIGSVGGESAAAAAAVAVVVGDDGKTAGGKFGHLVAARIRTLAASSTLEA